MNASTEFRIKPGTVFPLKCLLFASGSAVGLLVVRILLTHRLQHLYLPWNLFLAWIPLLLALVLGSWSEIGRTRHWKFYAAVFGWLIFFPNAPYIFTDLVHLKSYHGGIFWADLVLIFLFALIGLGLGFFSLHLVHGIAARAWSRRVGWVFASVATALSGLGIYIGRFLRWNTWDILLNPFGLLRDMATWTSQPAPLIYSTLFATFLFLAYLMFHAFTYLNPIEPPTEQK
ncbi:MAG TPA: DUF1361 domain-containing protein [Candidatus Saccharimonadales bacterium]|nr:DUF1361 domain-containing protein [Candidatus Saccharimonadales bacterium]